MAVTKKTDCIIPEVMAEMIDAKITALNKLTPYAKVDTTLQGQAGDTVTVPKWAYVGDAQDISEGEEITPSKLTSSKTQFTIKKAMKSISLSQESINSGYGNPVGQAESQLAKAIAGKVDNDLLACAYGATTVVNKKSGKIAYAGMVDAITKFADEEDDVEKVMFIHPEQETTLLKDANFISADKFEGSVAVRGSIGKVAGCWIKKSNKVSKVDAVTEVKGVYELEIKTALASGDSIKIKSAGLAEVTYEFTAGTTTASAQATAIKNLFGSDTVFDVTSDSAKVVFTQKAGGTGAIPTIDITGLTTGVAEIKTKTEGVASDVAHYINPIIKLEADSAETEYTDDELPALTIFLKADTSVDEEFFPKKQIHDITACKYYGVALTNDAKVVLVKFGLDV